jgi:hypothetical protein
MSPAGVNVTIAKQAEFFCTRAGSFLFIVLFIYFAVLGNFNFSFKQRHVCREGFGDLIGNTES